MPDETIWNCECGFDLQGLANQEAKWAPIGQRRMLITCPCCERVLSFEITWAPTVHPAHATVIQVLKGN